jgi:hypothetical protein
MSSTGIKIIHARALINMRVGTWECHTIRDTISLSDLGFIRSFVVVADLFLRGSSIINAILRFTSRYFSRHRKFRIRVSALKVGTFVTLLSF